MSSPNVGDWVELVREVDGAGSGTRGRVTSTGFLGGVDITTESGHQITGVPADAVRRAPAGTSSPGGDLGCAVIAVALTTTAAGVAAITSGWWA
ncbi:hypothetical protein MOQ72_37170 [Saccharopolyspora sp. K220]|uniref:hypothetical protein n=1 Tax=Saccharopolyspora soli TaxID=2926618 RepID=UPI001F562AAC|nr:hypothetical protein [Saccharopolyspora soli]MCI2423064.1 hypothetical protein [Saccharopolyspora soli]